MGCPSGVSSLGPFFQRSTVAVEGLSGLLAQKARPAALTRRPVSDRWTMNATPTRQSRGTRARSTCVSHATGRAGSPRARRAGCSGADGDRSGRAVAEQGLDRQAGVEERTLTVSSDHRPRASLAQRQPSVLEASGLEPRPRQTPGRGHFVPLPASGPRTLVPSSAIPRGHPQQAQLAEDQAFLSLKSQSDCHCRSQPQKDPDAAPGPLHTLLPPPGVLESPRFTLCDMLAHSLCKPPLGWPPRPQPGG